MKIFFIEPQWGDRGSFGVATTSPFTGNNSTAIGQQSNATRQISSAHFCFSHGYGYESDVIHTLTETVAYYDEATSAWKTKTESSYEQIVCDDTNYSTSMATTLVQMTTISTSTLNVQTVGIVSMLFFVGLAIAVTVATVTKKLL